MFYLPSKNLYISDHFLWTEEELDLIADLHYISPKLSDWEVKKLFPCKKILKDKEKGVKKRLEDLLQIERVFTNLIAREKNAQIRTIYECFRDGMIPVLRDKGLNRLNKIRKLIRYYDTI